MTTARTSGGVPPRTRAVELRRRLFHGDRSAASAPGKREMDADELDAEPRELRERQLGIRDVRPGAKRHLQQVGSLQARNAWSAGNEPADQLDVECPAGMERLVEGSREHIGSAERLGAALGVVDAEIEDQRGCRGEDAAQVVAERVTLDPRAEERDPRR